jgi:hypothetical protein
MVDSVLMPCGSSRSSEITSDWDILLTSRTEERARLPSQSERRAVRCLKLKFKRQLDRARSADLVERVEAAVRASGSQTVRKGLR